ncbi:MAG: hypothetical protein M3O35_15025 [Acidobacteriota bacterium]|jgi:hypothetical protein|nr:hypothetical protein [Acidobacteriota bacterium]
MRSMEPPSSRLTALRNGLLRLHKTLLDSEQSFYERDVQRIATRGELLGLVLNDPWFAYLHELSELVVLIDETVDSKEGVSAEEAARLINQSRDLLTPAEQGTGFRKQYFEALQRDPDVVIAHGEMMRVLTALL